MFKKVKTKISRALAMMLAIVSVLTLIPTKTASAAEDLHGYWGWIVSDGNVPVYQYKQLSNKIGSVYPYEGVTVLVEEANSYYIEYSTSSGAKRGYIAKDDVYREETETCVGKLNTTAKVYYGKSTTAYQSVGTIYSGEYVAVLADDGTWTYVEYNTTSGRKRGYISHSSLTIFNKPSGMKSVYKSSGGTYNAVLGAQTIFAGPSEQYYKVGSIGATEAVTIIAEYNISFNKFYFIEYTVNGSSLKKSGYVLAGLDIFVL